MPRLSVKAVKLALAVDGLAARFKVAALDGREEISRPFQFDLQVTAEGLAETPAALLDRAATLRLRGPDGERVVRGIVGHVEAGPADAGGTALYLSLVPPLWRLAQRQTSRVFQERSVPEVVAQVLADAGIGDSQFDLADDYPAQDTLVQYDESDFDFISRLLEDEGISYVVDAESGTLVFGDGEAGLVPPLGGNITAKYRAGGGAREGVVTAFRVGEGLRPGKVSLRAYDFRTPATALDATASDARFQEREVFAYPGGFAELPYGQARAQARLEGYLAEAAEGSGESTLLRLVPGAPITLAGTPGGAFDGDNLVTGVVHSYDGEGEDAGYANRFTCLPAGQRFRPARVTPRPLAVGAESATVVGPAGETIHTDEHGRVRLRFHWDRTPSSEANTAWVRVAQPWAGQGHGMLFLPRVGSEVLVQFLHGDPRDPVVIGGLYNGRDAPPVALPAGKSRSGIVTRTTAANPSSARRGHALLFEDAAGKEEVLLQAERRLGVTVAGDAAFDIACDQQLTVGRGRTASVGANETVTVGANRSVTVGAAQTETIAKDLTQQVGGDLSLTVGKDATIEVAKGYALKAGTITLEAEDQIALKVGKAQIVLKKNGDIDIKGANIAVTGSGNVTIKGSKVTTN